MPFFKNTRGVNIYYEIENSECVLPPLVFVHGYGSTTSMFAKQIPVLRPFFKLILFDAQGHGKSRTSQNTIQTHLINQTVQDLEQLLDLLEIRSNIGIIGHSLFGNGVAMSYTLAHPSNVVFLIILNGGTLLLDSSYRNIFWNLLPQFTRMNFHEIINVSIDILLDKTVPFIHGAIAAFGVPDSDSSEIHDLDERIRDDINEMVDEQFDPSSILCPTLIIGAELDNYAPAYMSKLLRKQIPHSQLKIISMSGHFGPSQRHRDYNQQILKFLEQNKFIHDSQSQ